jgi:hydrogenase maturation factor
MAVLGADRVQRWVRRRAPPGVQIVTGDTKVVERGHGDGLYINTAGVGVVRTGVDGWARCVRDPATA